MRPICIFVVSPETTLTSYLASSLPPTEFEIISMKPGDEFTPQVERAHIAVVDRINERPEKAHIEIYNLKKYKPDLLIIAVSEQSTALDAAVVRQGIFYYLAGYSELKLLRVIRAAAGTIQKINNEILQPQNEEVNRC